MRPPTSHDVQAYLHEVQAVEAAAAREAKKATQEQRVRHPPVQEPWPEQEEPQPAQEGRRRASQRGVWEARAK